MAKFSREAESDDEPRRLIKSSALPAAILVGFGVLAVVCTGIVVVMVLFGLRATRQVEELSRIEADTKTAAAKAEAEAAKATKTRDEWRTLLVGKSKDEVLKEAGEPDRTDDGTGDWSYDRRSIDPISGNTDPTMWVRFDKSGKVVRVEF